jgi:hypothetical protein
MKGLTRSPPALDRNEAHPLAPHPRHRTRTFRGRELSWAPKMRQLAKVEPCP